MQKTPSNRFRPSHLLRNPHVQTMLSSSSLRTWRISADPQQTQPITLDVGEGVQLSGVLWNPEGRTAKGLIILLHGWEGSVDPVCGFAWVKDGADTNDMM